MAATNQAIQILTTLEYLGKYGGTPYFGLVLQTGVSQMLGGTLTIDSKIQNILEPWMWWDPGKPQPIAQTDASKSLNVQPPKIDLWWATPVAPVPTLITPVLDSLAFSVDRSITDQLGKDCTSALPTVDRPGHYLDWSDPASKSNSVSRRADGRNVLPWPAHLAQVTRYPYPIPHLLNLSFLLKVEGFDPSMFTDQTIYFFATVSFKTTVGANIVTYTAPDPVKDKDKFTPPDANSRLVIPLINQDNRTDYSVAVTTQPLPLKGLAPAAFAVTPSPTTYTAETADWQAHLSSSVASTFDLSARLVDTVRQACDQVAGPLPDPKNVTAKKAYDDATSLRKAVAAEFNGFVTAVLTAQREIVAYGCQTGPNGKSLIDRLLDAWVTDSKNPKNRAFATALSKDVNTQRASETINNVASFDTWLALLKGLPVFATNPILPPSPAGSIATVFDGTKKGKADTDPAYKKGDTVIFHGRCYIATSDVPSPTNGGSANVIDATHWRCLTPLLPFYVKDKFYKIGDQVLFGDSVYQAVADPVDINTPQPAPPNAGAWVSPSAFTPKVDPTNLPDRIIAVEHLQLQFTQPDILSQILLAQWKSVFDAHSASWSTAENAQFQSFLNNASANLAVWDVRGLLLQCHLNESWTKITQSPTSRYSVRTQIPIQLDARIDELLNQLPSAPGTMPAFAATLKVKVEAWIADRINLLVPAPTSAPAQPTRSSQGLSVMLGTLDANGDKLDQSDPLRSIAGYCVLMRPLAAPRTAASSWRCLNAGIPIASVNPPANIAPGKPAPAIPAVQGLTDPVVIPVPMHNQDGLRRAILTYDNQPLMCSSPAHAFGDGLVPAPTRDDSRKFDRMISFQHLSVSKELAKGVTALERWKIPGLAFKQSYEFLLGAVSNSGALPPEFADPKNPGIFKFDSLNKPPDAIHKPLPPTITPVSYFRTVPVGDLRFASSFSPTPLLSTPPVPLPEKAGTFDKLRLPPIPDDVQPRASEFFASSLAPVPTAADKSQVMPPVGTTPGKPSKPLIVLSPYPTNASYAEFDLWIQKPTTDFLTWDRTQAAITGTHQARQWAWQLFNTNARKQNSSFDLSLEDPAVDSLSIDVKDETGASVIVTGLSTLPWLHADIQNPTTATALQTTTQPIALKIVTNVDAPTKLTGSLAVDPKSSSTFTLTLPQGFLGSITLQPKLRAGFEKQFATGISSAPGAYTLLVETANRAFPQQDKLQNALSIQPPVAPTDPITFTLVGQSDQAAWKQICRVDLQAQLWRWDGRPARSFPFDQITPIKYYGGIPAIDPKTSVPVPQSNKLLHRFSNGNSKLSPHAPQAIRPRDRWSGEVTTS